MKYCVYLTIYSGSALPKRYIGSTSIERILAGYNGSVKSKKYKSTYVKEQHSNKHLFKTRILKRFETRTEALEFETILQLKYNVVKSSLYMNESVATKNGCFGRDMSGELHPMFGKTHSDDVKKIISEKTKLAYKEGRLISPFKTLDVSGENNPFFGLKHSEETKNKMRKPKQFIPKYECPHCNKLYDGGNLFQHMLRQGYNKESIIEIRKDLVCKNL